VKDKKVLILISVSVLLIILIGVFRPREIDWRPTFSEKDKIPYGSYILYQSLPQLFGEKMVSITKKQPFDYVYNSGRRMGFCFVQEQFDPGETNTHSLLDWANAGHDVFISSARISGPLVDSLNLKLDYNLRLGEAMKVFGNDTVSAFSTNFTNPALHSDSGYWYRRSAVDIFYDVNDPVFANQDSGTDSRVKGAIVLGTDNSSNPNFIVIYYGEGRIFLHNNPYAFTNYYMLYKKNADYAAGCLSYLHEDEIVWDEYFKGGGENTNESSLRFILSREPLRWAYYTLLGSLIIFVLFNIKRRQRVVPLNDPYTNTSLEFARLVGTLYYNQSDHRNIMIKKINYLLEFIRNKYHLDTREINNEFRDKLAAKTGMDRERIAHLFNLMNSVRQKTWLSKQELLELNDAIQYFKTHCQ
jgi:hypothetical protein